MSMHRVRLQFTQTTGNKIVTHPAYWYTSSCLHLVFSTCYLLVNHLTVTCQSRLERLSMSVNLWSLGRK
jgi:hypothetical protein